MTKMPPLKITGPAKLEDHLRAILACLRPPSLPTDVAGSHQRDRRTDRRDNKGKLKCLT